MIMYGRNRPAGTAGLHLRKIFASVLILQVLTFPFCILSAEPGMQTDKDTNAELDQDKSTPEDPELLQARIKARSTLNYFWKKLDNPESNEESFMIKVRIKDSHGVEDFWCARIKRQESRIECTIANEPQTVKSVTFGQIISLDESQIVDWMYRKNGFIHGNFSMRVLIERMPEEKAEFYRSMLADIDSESSKEQ